VKINKKQANLLRKSQIILDYPWLHKLLLEHGKLSLHDIPDEFKNEFQHIVPYIIKQCREEWKKNKDVEIPVEDLLDDRRPCGLCGTPNRFIFYIENRLNGNTLNVGSECVKEFLDIDRLCEGLSVDQLKREAAKIRRRKIINGAFPGIDRLISAWEEEVNKFRVVIPHHLSSDYLQDGNTLSNIYEQYLNEHMGEEAFPAIEALLQKRENYLSTMAVYEREVIDKPFVATKEIADWLNRRNDHETLECIKQNGYVTKYTISKIWERNFIVKITPLLERLLDPLSIVIQKTDFDIHSFVLKENKSDLCLYISFKTFFEYFGGLLFDEKPVAPLILQNIVRLSEIKEPDQIEKAIKNIQSVIRRSKVGISLYGNSISNNEIDLIDRRSNLVVVDKLNDFMKNFKAMAFNLPRPTIEELEAYVRELPGKRYTRDELRDARRAAREAMNRR